MVLCQITKDGIPGNLQTNLGTIVQLSRIQESKQDGKKSNVPHVEMSSAKEVKIYKNSIRYLHLFNGAENSQNVKPLCSFN